MYGSTTYLVNGLFNNLGSLVYYDAVLVCLVSEARSIASQGRGYSGFFRHVRRYLLSQRVSGTGNVNCKAVLT